MAQPPEQVEPVEPIRWYQALYTALAHPSVSQYQTLAANPNAKLRTAFTWVAIASDLAVMGVMGLMYRSEIIGYQRYGITLPVERLVTMLKWTFGLGIAITIANLIAFWLFVFAQEQLLGGQNSKIGQLAYVQAASFAPTLFIAITLTEYLRVVSIVSVIACVIYAMISAKAIYNRGWVRSISSVLLALVIGGVFLFIFVVAIFFGVLSLTARGE